MHSNETATASYSSGLFSQQHPGPIFKTCKGESCYLVVIPWVRSALVFSFSPLASILQLHNQLEIFRLK